MENQYTLEDMQECFNCGRLTSVSFKDYMRNSHPDFMQSLHPLPETPELRVGMTLICHTKPIDDIEVGKEYEVSRNDGEFFSVNTESGYACLETVHWQRWFRAKSQPQPAQPQDEWRPEWGMEVEVSDSCDFLKVERGRFVGMNPEDEIFSFVAVVGNGFVTKWAHCRKLATNRKVTLDEIAKALGVERGSFEIVEK